MGLAARSRRLSRRSESTSCAFVYGSIAKGTDTARSDIDLMVISEAAYPELYDALQEAEEILGRPVPRT